MQYRKRMIRKGTALLLSALLLASAMPFAVSAEEVSAKTTEYVNFRTGPGTNYSSKGVISLGTTVTVTDTSNSQWYAVRLSNGSTGYIFAQYLKFTGNTSAPTATPAPSTRQMKKPPRQRSTSISARARAQITALRVSFRPALRLP